MSNTDSEHLEFLRLARDKVALAIVNEEDATTVTVGPKTGTFKARDSVLENLEVQIAKYERRVSRSSGRRSRNRARLQR